MQLSVKPNVNVGDHIGRFTVLDTDVIKTYSNGRTTHCVRCVCSCEYHSIRDIPWRDFFRKKGLRKSCNRCSTSKYKYTIGIDAKKNRIYGIWKGIRKRCNYAGDKNYKWYGGSGISICKEWDDFIAFYEWSLKNGYADGLTIDRIDPKLNYSPENCRWVDMFCQNNHKSSNHYLEYNGKKYTMAELARFSGLSYFVVRMRVYRGWDADRIVNTPVDYSRSTCRKLPSESET